MLLRMCLTIVNGSVVREALYTTLAAANAAINTHQFSAYKFAWSDFGRPVTCIRFSVRG